MLQIVFEGEEKHFYANKLDKVHMKVAVLLKQVPDLAEELEVDESGKALDTEYIKFRLNEYDEHALEEAVCLKEAGQAAEVAAIALDGEEVDKALFTAMAKGADKAIKLIGAEVEGSRQAAALFAETLGMDYDLIMTGVQSVDDRDGMMGPMLSSMLKVPCVSVVTRVEGKDSSVTVHKEYFGGLMAAFDVQLPAVLGIQAARQTPRYAPVSKVRQIQQSAIIEEKSASGVSGSATSKVTTMAPPTKTGGAKILGSVDELMELLKEKGVA